MAQLKYLAAQRQFASLNVNAMISDLCYDRDTDSNERCMLVRVSVYVYLNKHLIKVCVAHNFQSTFARTLLRPCACFRTQNHRQTLQRRTFFGWKVSYAHE